MTITFHFVASQADDAQQALQECLDLYGQCDAESADVIVALGGDGMMLQAVNSVLNKNKPIYGMNKGTIGFLMNEYSAEDLPKRVEQ
ncbi:MAG: NAD(+)/NADH kinase, partial [Hyphomicrobiales bacterium]